MIIGGIGSLSEVQNKIVLADNEAAIKRGKQIVNRREQGPTLAQQTDSYRFFDQQINALGQPYDVTHIPIDVLDIMQRDPMIAFGLHFKRVPLIRANWHIKCEDARIAAFIDNALREIYPRLVAQFYRSRNFGFSPVVKRFKQQNPDWKFLDASISDNELDVWPDQDIDAVVWNNFTPLPCNPEYTIPKFKANGEFNGIEYNPKAELTGVAFKTIRQDNGKDIIPVSHALWFTNERDSVDGSLWGYPSTGYVYRYWWSYWYRWALYDRFFERKSDPPYVVYYPDGSLQGDYLEGDEDNVAGISNQQTAISLGINAKSGGAVALPSQAYTDHEDRPGSLREWEIKELEVKGDMTHFVSSFEYLDVMKLRGLFIPEQAVMEGSKGQSSRNVASAHQDIMAQAQASDIDELDDIINKYIIPDLVAANFPQFKGEVRKITTGFTEADTETMKEFIKVIGQQDPTIVAGADVDEMLDRVGLPTLSRKDILAREKRIQNEMKKLGPTIEVEAKPNEQAGITEEGLYYQPRQVIRLAEDTEFVDNLPKTKVYEDAGVKAGARQIRTLWKKEFDEILEDFANYMRQVSLSDIVTDNVALAEVDPRPVAEQIVAGWDWPTSRIESLSEASVGVLKRVMGVAARRELRNVERNSAFDIDADEVSTYLSGREEVFENAITETTKNDFVTFVAAKLADGYSANQIGAEVLDHFGNTPNSRANRIARAEIRDAYNFSMLVAGEQAGFNTVQAHDDNLGTSDPECVARDGSFFSIQDALVENTKEHPYGTLYWSYSGRDNLSEVREEFPEDSENLAYFDDKSGIIYIDPSVSEKERSEYLKSLGAIFEYE